MKRVLIYHGENNPVIWDASTDDLLRMAYVSLFNYFDVDCEFYSDLNEGELFLEEEGLKKKEALKTILPDHPLYNEAQAKTRFLDSEKRELEDRRLQLLLLGKARKGDPVAAKQILSSRLDYEYEGWDIYKVEEA